MILGNTAAVAVIAEYIRSVVAVLVGHGLFFNVSIQPPKLALHIGNAFRTYRTLVACIAPLGEARLVDTVATPHKCHRFVGGEHVFATDRTVAFCTSFDTFVGAFGLDRHASRTFFAVEEVLA
jgi:hypothetical protein